jgi:quinoprotein relay system zinc metallohydrolase 2
MDCLHCPPTARGPSRRFAQCVAAWLVAGLADGIAASPAAMAADAAPVPPLPMVRIAEGAYVHFGAQQDSSADNGGAIANVGFVVGQRCVAVIDTGGSRVEGEQLRTAMREVTELPVCAVINTHMHPDHVYGNSAFRGGEAGGAGATDGTEAADPARAADFIGHVHLAAALAARRETYARAQQRTLGAQAATAPLVGPTLGVTPGHPYTLDLGGRRLEIRAWRTAHTDNDVTVFDPLGSTLWAGDLLFSERIPVIDGSLTGWLSVMDEIEKMNPRQIVPGHGPIGDWRTALTAQRRYLQALALDTRAAIREHRSMLQAVEQVAAGERGKWLLFDEYHRRNVAAAYAELEWEE